MPNLFTPKRPLIIDNIGMSQDFLKWLTDLLAQYDTTLVEWFKLLPLKANHMYRGQCKYPVRVQKGSRSFKSGYRIRNSIHKDVKKYPYTCTHIKKGTITHDLLGDKYCNYYEYVYHEETFVDREELLAFICGHEMHHWLRHSKQIGGRNTEPAADQFGLHILQDWRLWKGYGSGNNI